MIRKLFFLLLTAAALLPLSAGLCEPSEVELLVDLPADAVLETDLLFEDGSFSRLYTLPGGGTLSLLRWMHFTMDANELLESEWTDISDRKDLSLTKVGAYPASGLEADVREEKKGYHLTLVLVTVEDSTLIFETLIPEGSKAHPELLESLSVQGGGSAPLG